MKKQKQLVAGILLSSMVFSSAAGAHPGRTDSNGGHTCRTNCEKWGYEYGEYHYHNGGSGGSSSGSSSSGGGSGSAAPNKAAVEEKLPAGTFKVNLPAYSIQVNGQQIPNNSLKYPVVVHKDITYFPMTWNFTQALGLETKWDPSVGFVIRRTESPAGLLNLDYGTPASKLQARLPDFNVYVNDVWLDNSREEYPVLVLNDVTYFPMTWKFAVEELGLQLSFGSSVFSISK